MNLDRITIVFTVLVAILGMFIIAGLYSEWVVSFLPALTLLIGLIMFGLLWRYIGR